MESHKISGAVVMSFMILLCSFLSSEATTSYSINICIKNCAQCKKLFGPYFEGQLCADACVKFKGKMIPDCEDINSIAPFLNKFE
ncbi:Eclosion hormone [Blattella germanica]|nr:Eclosion hormone [Blattella germanica]